MFSPTSIKVHLLDKIPAANARLLTTVLELFANIAAHSKANGMPPRRLAGTLGAYIFGLPDDETFDATYIEWQRATNATEHLLLAYVRRLDILEVQAQMLMIINITCRFDLRILPHCQRTLPATLWATPKL